jgi:NPCBM/NEW2 domain/Glycosyl transferase family 2
MKQGHRIQGAPEDCSLVGRDGPPLISCVMPTYGRPDYVSESVALFLAQDYPARELVILNDCPGQVMEIDHPDVHIVNSSTRYPNLGDKRNALIELARGDYIAIWDDDDIYLPWRLSLSMQQMVAGDLRFYCPADYWAYWGEEFLHDNYCIREWISHPLWMFRKSLWRAVNGYPPITLKEDSAFSRRVDDHFGRSADAPLETCQIARHDRFMILRGKSRYRHTSIVGGQSDPETSPGRIPIAPRPIADDRLRKLHDALIESRATARRQGETFARLLASQVESDRGRAGLVPVRSLALLHASTGYGEVGFDGMLGYENQRVEILGRTFEHSISAHAPSHLTYFLDGRYSDFRAQVALNDDVASGLTAADFLLVGDGKVIAVARNVLPGAVPRTIGADVSGVGQLSLLAETTRRDHCHTIWIDPVVWNSAPCIAHQPTAASNVSKGACDLAGDPCSLRRHS